MIYKIFVEEFLLKEKQIVNKIEVQKYHELFKKFNLQRNRRESILVEYYGRFYDHHGYFSSGFRIENFIHSRNLDIFLKVIENL